MRTVFLLIIITLLALSASGQSDVLAKNYFERGQFEKALPLYEALYQQQPLRREYLLALVATHQQLENFEAAETLLETELKRSRNNAALYIELGRNQLLQKNSEAAEVQYQKALDIIDEQPNQAYSIAMAFRNTGELDYAVQAFTKAMAINPNANYHTQLAAIYGEQGKLEWMFDSYLDILDKSPNYLSIVMRNFGAYTTEDPQNEANDLLRKALIKRSQSNPDPMYNDLLAWLYMQQNEYGKALVQQKAVYRRTHENLNRFMDLAGTAVEQDDHTAAEDALQFVIENTQNEALQLDAHRMRMQVAVKKASEKEYPEIVKQFETLIDRFGAGDPTFALQLDYYMFLAFEAGQKGKALSGLLEMKGKTWSRYREAALLMALADVLVFDEKFNEALIYYSQIQHKVKNDPLAQEARYKVARTSYFKGDFEWAQTQLDVLKKSTSQLIANDAMELSLLINDNAVEDSTHTALKKYARADLLLLQKKYADSEKALGKLLNEHPNAAVTAHALYKQAEAYEKTGQYTRAEANYQSLLEHHKSSVLIDKALFRLGQLYQYELQQPEKAQQVYEQLIFKHPDSIFFVEARKQYRSLRGDAVRI